MHSGNYIHPFDHNATVWEIPSLKHFLQCSHSFLVLAVVILKVTFAGPFSSVCVKRGEDLAHQISFVLFFTDMYKW